MFINTKREYSALEELAIKYLKKELTKEYLLANGYDIKYFCQQLGDSGLLNSLQLSKNIVRSMLRMLIDLETVDIDTLALVINEDMSEDYIYKFMDLLKYYKGSSVQVEIAMKSCIGTLAYKVNCSALKKFLDIEYSSLYYGVLYNIFKFGTESFKDSKDYYDKCNMLVQEGEKRRASSNVNSTSVHFPPLFYMDYDNCYKYKGLNSYISLLNNLDSDSRDLIETSMLRCNTAEDHNYSSVFVVLYYIKNYIKSDNKKGLIDKVLDNFQFRKDLVEEFYIHTEHDNAVDSFFLDNWELLYPYIDTEKHRSFLINVVRYYFRTIVSRASRNDNMMPLYKLSLDLIVKYNIFEPDMVFDMLYKYPKLLKELDLSILDEYYQMKASYIIFFKNKEYDECKGKEVNYKTSDLHKVARLLAEVCYNADASDLHFAQKLLYNYSDSERFKVLTIVLRKDMIHPKDMYMNIEVLRRYKDLKYILSSFYVNIFREFYTKEECEYISELEKECN